MFVVEGKIDFQRLNNCVTESIVFLDNVIDASSFPCFESKTLALNRRRIGLGIMGLDTMFEKLGVDYSSKEAIDLCLEISKLFKEFSISSSEELAKKSMSFPDFNKSSLKQPRRNSYLNSIAPTGAISMIFQNSSGIEPTFANKIVKGDIIVSLRRQGNNTKTVYEVSPESQIDVLSIWQGNIDGGISKTLNLTEDKTYNHIFAAVILAWIKGCKGLSIFRHNSRKSSFTISSNQ